MSNATSTDQNPSQMVTGARAAIRSIIGLPRLTTHVRPKSNVKRLTMKSMYCLHSGTGSPFG